MKTRKRHIPIFTSVTNDNLPHLIVTLKSISEYLDEECIIDARVLTAGLAAYNQRKLRHVKLFNVEITIVDINSRVEDCRADLEERLGSFYGEESFYPFFIADMYPRLARAMYVSCGTLVREDIEKLYHADIGGDLIGGMRRTDGFEDQLELYRRTWVGIDEERYVDTSVLLMNLSLFRKYRIESRFTRLLMGYNFDTVSAANDYMNFLCKRHVSILNDEWRREDGTDGIVSFAPYRLPWHYVSIPYADEFWDVARTTPLYDDVRSCYCDFNDEEKDRATKALDAMIAHAQRLAAEDGGFSKVLGDNYLIE